ncbi:HNH endonuclease [Salinicola corii]|uniref:HNH endonuclease n=1 Tax=Salinicola corii TaxID=2606937 RepID=A0A640WJN0_9GAMM|nr:HNH endonuclease signature motif containing protein [Salinicola corii]KAA0020741.1 HNH endonuclease [Salinicola corii]
MDNKTFIMQRLDKKQSGCWEWKLYRDPDGYGRFTRPKISPMAHRAAYIILIGEIPAGFDVDHKCWNPACCNPEHLRLLISSENRSRQRSSLQSRCKHGHEMKGDNVAIYANGRKACKTCVNQRVRNYSARKKERAA